MNSSNSRRHKWVSVGAVVAPQSQELVAERLCCCFVLLIGNVLSGNTVLWWLGHCVFYPECLVQRKVYIQEIFVYESSLSSKRRWPAHGRLYPDTVAWAWWWEMQSLDSGPDFLHLWNLLIVHSTSGEMKVLGWMCLCYICAPYGLK